MTKQNIAAVKRPKPAWVSIREVIPAPLIKFQEPRFELQGENLLEFEHYTAGGLRSML